MTGPAVSAYGGAPARAARRGGLRVLFLDVDGVITKADGSGRLDEPKLRRLERLANETKAVVCISSNWRLFSQLTARLEQALDEHGGIAVIGSTPDHGERTHGGAVRPEEIIAFLNAWSGAHIESWCAVDDRPLLEEQGGALLEGHFVQVDERLGLTDRAVDEIVALLLPDGPEEPELVSASQSPKARPDASRCDASPDTVLSELPGPLQPGASSGARTPPPQSGFSRASEEHLRSRSEPSRRAPAAGPAPSPTRGAATPGGGASKGAAPATAASSGAAPVTPRTPDGGTPRPRTPKSRSRSGTATGAARSHDKLPPLSSAADAATRLPPSYTDSTQLLVPGADGSPPSTAGSATPGHRRNRSLPGRAASQVARPFAPSNPSRGAAGALTAHARPQRTGRGWTRWGGGDGMRAEAAAARQQQQEGEAFMQRLQRAETNDEARLSHRTARDATAAEALLELHRPARASAHRASAAARRAAPPRATDGGRAAGGSSLRRHEPTSHDWLSAP